MTDDLRRDRDPAERVDHDESRIGSTPPHPSPAEGGPVGSDDAGASIRPPRPSQAEGDRRDGDASDAGGAQHEPER